MGEPVQYEPVPSGHDMQPYLPEPRLRDEIRAYGFNILNLLLLVGIGWAVSALLEFPWIWLAVVAGLLWELRIMVKKKATLIQPPASSQEPVQFGEADWTDETEEFLVEELEFGEDAERTQPLPKIAPPTRGRYEAWLADDSQGGQEWVFYQSRLNAFAVPRRSVVPGTLLLVALFGSFVAFNNDLRLLVVKFWMTVLLIAAAVVVATILPLFSWGWVDNLKQFIRRWALKVAMIAGGSLLIFATPPGPLVFTAASLVSAVWILRVWVVWRNSIYTVTEDNYREEIDVPWVFGGSTARTLDLVDVVDVHVDRAVYEKAFRINSSTVLVETPGETDSWAHDVRSMRDADMLEVVLKRPKDTTEELLREQIELQRQQLALQTELLNELRGTRS